MKLKLLIYFLLIVAFISCDKDAGGKGNKIKYEVTTTASSFNTTYVNENAATVGGSYSSGWVYEFNTERKPFTASIRVVVAAMSNIDITVKIYVNDNVVETKSSLGTTFADFQTQYVIQ